MDFPTSSPLVDYLHLNLFLLQLYLIDPLRKRQYLAFLDAQKFEVGRVGKMRGSRGRNGSRCLLSLLSTHFSPNWLPSH